MNVEAGVFGFGEVAWKEEVVLHDGKRVIVNRSQSYGGRREVGKGAPIREHVLTFHLPGASKPIKWVSEFSEDVGRANFDLLALHMLNDTAYVVATPNLCLSYNKWDRPNPPYVLFRHNGADWQRISLTDLPREFTTLNVIINVRREEDIKRATAQHGYVSAEKVQALNESLREPELKSILREPVKPGTPGSAVNCEELVKYKGYWIMPNDPVARGMVDKKK